MPEKSRDYRHPKTTQEKKANLAAKDDGVKIRGKRCGKHLPSVYDDIPKQDAGKKNLSWKRLRKTKFKPQG